MAGGKEAVYRVVPGVEDDKEKIIEELKQIEIKENDAVIGVSSSGSTPYVVFGNRVCKECRVFYCCSC